MKELIYYPGFEVKDITWLKFALLYIDELDPIIPISGDKHLSTFYKKLREETDLIQFHRPAYEEGWRATSDAVEITERILRNPRLYSRLLGKRDIWQDWQNPANQTYTLFQEKYVGIWEEFCLENKLARHSSHGMLLPKELAFIYMSLLAQAIADAKAISPITDHRELDRLSMLTRRTSIQSRQKMNVAQSVIKLRLPSDIEEIEIDQIIRFRNKAGFKRNLAAFHQELETFLTNVEGPLIERDFVMSFNKVWKDFTDDIVQIGTGGITVALAAWIGLNMAPIEVNTIVKEAILPGISFTVGAALPFKNTWSNTRTRRYCRKYLADIKSFSRR